MMVSHHLSVGSIAEWCVCWELAVAHLVVSTLADVERNRSITSRRVVAQTITPRSWLRDTAAAPRVDLALLEIAVVWVETSDQRDTSRSVVSFLAECEDKRVSLTKNQNSLIDRSNLPSRRWILAEECTSKQGSQSHRQASSPCEEQMAWE